MLPYLGKILGGLIGLNFGFLGLMLGVMVGHVFDVIAARSWASEEGYGQRVGPFGDFAPEIDEDGLAYGLFRLFGAFAVASGGPNDAQVNYLQNVISRYLNLGYYDFEAGVAAFRRAVQERPSPLEVARDLAHRFILDTLTLRWVWTVCKDLLRLGRPTEAVWQELEATAECFGFRVRRRSARSRFEEDFSSYASHRKPNRDPYQVLGLSRDATVEQIKASFRRLARENHPDALSHLAPDDPERQRRQEAFIQIQEAYEAIRKERGF